MLDFNHVDTTVKERTSLDRESIRSQLLMRLESLVNRLFPNGRRRGNKYYVGDVHGNKGDSLEIVLEGSKAGLWIDRATDIGGDLFALIGHRLGLSDATDFPAVLQHAASLAGAPVVTPPHARRKSPPIDELGAETAKWLYHDPDGRLLAVVRRYDPPGQSKEFRVWDVQRRKMRPPDPRPLYNQPGLREARQVILVEGEKCADSLIGIGVAATSAMNGAYAPVEKTDWSPLATKEVLIWPDRDKPGWDYAMAAAEAVIAAGAKSCEILVPPEDATEGWDAADALADGFDVAQFLERGPRWNIHHEPPSIAPITHQPCHPPKITLRPIGNIVAERRSVQWLLPRVIEANVLAVIAGKRGTFKSFIALDWLMRIATTGKPAVMLSGEGAGLDRRVDAWMRAYGANIDIDTLPLLALERAVNLHAKEVMRALVAAIEAANFKPAIICIDTMSKYTAGLDENSNAEVAAFLTDLGAHLRDRYQATVLLVAHTGHGEGKRPRGAYALMANPDSEFIVERQDGAMMVAISRERYKDAPSLAPLAYTLEPVDLGRLDELGDPVNSLILRPAEQAAPRVRAKGANQVKALVALKEWSRANADAIHITSPDISALLKAQGIARTRRPDALNFLVNSRILTAAIGGFTVHRDML
jgi:hypothetical protein